MDGHRSIGRGLRERDERGEETRLLASWAHDLGKPLQVIERYARRMVEQAAPDPRLRSLAESIVALSDDALAVVEGLMAGDVEADPLPRKRPRRTLDEVIDRVVGVLEGLHGPGRLRVESPIDELRLERDDVLYRVIVNLTDNALRASGPSGRADLRVATGCSGSREAPGSRAARELVIEVFDRGTGMSPLVRSRAFERYFSTRKTRGPTGLGLEGTRSIVESIGGRLELESAEGTGTCVRVFLSLS